MLGGVLGRIIDSVAFGFGWVRLLFQDEAFIPIRFYRLGWVTVRQNQCHRIRIVVSVYEQPEKE